MTKSSMPYAIGLFCQLFDRIDWCIRNVGVYFFEHWSYIYIYAIWKPYFENVYNY